MTPVARARASRRGLLENVSVPRRRLETTNNRLKSGRLVDFPANRRRGALMELPRCAGVQYIRHTKARPRVDETRDRKS